MDKKKLAQIWLQEPALIISAVRAILVAAIGFGLNLSGDQITSIVVAMEAVFAIFTRQSVYAPASVEKMVTTGKRRRAKQISPVKDVDLPAVDDDQK